MCVNVYLFSCFWLTSLCIQALGSFTSLELTHIRSCYGWVIFHCIYGPCLLCPFLYRWPSRWLPRPGYCTLYQPDLKMDSQLSATLSLPSSLSKLFSCFIFSAVWIFLPLSEIIYFSFYIWFTFIFFILKLNILNWIIVDLQCHVSFRCTAKWVSYTYTYIHSFFF